jgi:hypothetical protein
MFLSNLRQCAPEKNHDMCMKHSVKQINSKYMDFRAAVKFLSDLILDFFQA